MHRVHPAGQYLLGFDLGGTKCAAVLGHTAFDQSQLTVTSRAAIATEKYPNPTELLAELEAQARILLADQNIRPEEVAGIGISCGGPLDSSRGVILGPPNLPGWDHVEVVRYFTDTLGRPARLENDANAGALAEWRWGGGRGTRNMIFLTFGTGMGAGLILNGQLYAGTNDMAGEVGHVGLAADGPVGYGKAGSFEGFCSGGGMARLARQRIHEAWAQGQIVRWCADPEALETLSAHDVFLAARAEDRLALELVHTVAQRLGQGLALLVDVLNPEAIVIGSIFTRQRALLWPEAERVLRRDALPRNLEVCRVVPAELGESIGDFACLAVALQAK